MEPEGSLPHSQASATCPYPGPAQSSPYPHPTSWRSILILSTHLRLGVNPHCCGHPPYYTLQGKIVNPHCCGHSPDCTLKATMSTHTLQCNNVKLHCCGRPPDHPLQGNMLKPKQCGFTVLPYSEWLATAAS